MPDQANGCSDEPNGNNEDPLEARVQRILAENERFIPTRSLVRPAQTLGEHAQDLFRRFLTNPAQVNPVEVAYLREQAIAGGVWRARVLGTDDMAAQRQERVQVLAEIERVTRELRSTRRVQPRRPALTLHVGGIGLRDPGLLRDHPTEVARQALLAAAEVEAPEWAPILRRVAAALPRRAPLPPQ